MIELISVIVPVYKTEKYVIRCIDSIRKQDHTNFEIILVDDGSPDDSGIICDKIALYDKRIRVVHKENGGLSSARNTGIDIAKGKYICFVDSDDYIEKDYLSSMYNLITKYDADLVKVNYVEISVDNYSEISNSCDETVYKGEEVEQAFLDLRVDSVCVFMYKRNVIGDTRFPEGKTSEDIPFNFEVFQKAESFVYAPINKYYYYHNPESISNGPLDRNMLNYLYFREAIFNHYARVGNNLLLTKAEALYARAAMGLMARMALFGIASDLSEKQCKMHFKSVFYKHSKAFYKNGTTETSRKLLALLVFHFYPVAKMIGKIAKDNRVVQ